MLPFQRRLVQVDGVRLHTIDHGEGPAVFMMHGNPTWSFLWRKVAAALPEFRIIAPDLWGFGLSDKPRNLSAHQLERHIALVSGLLRELEVGPLIVVGQDWGGPISLGAAMRHAPGVRAVVLGNTAVLAPRRPLKTTAFHRFAHLPGLSDLAFRVGGFPQRGLHRAQGRPSAMSADVRRAYRWPLRRWSDRAGPLALARMVPHREEHPSLVPLDAIDGWIRDFRGPTGLVWGTRDPILGRALRRHQRELPAARVWTTEAGHFLQEEASAELAEAIRWAHQSAS